jgi:very-short-patch-repair endonuclease
MICQRAAPDFSPVGKQLPDRCLRLLARQCGVLASWQTDAAGISRYDVQDLLRSQRWQRLNFGTYAAFTGQPPREATLWAAVLRAGPQAILSHETSAELDGLLNRRSRDIHVTVPHRQHRLAVKGIVIHQSARDIAFRQVERLPPRTMPEETVLDLAQAATSFDDVIALLARACQRRLITPFLLSDTIRMRAKQRWRAEIAQALCDVAAGVHSPLEYRYVRDVERAHGLPTADRQARASHNGHDIFRDALYRRYRLIVELDGRANHPDEQRWSDQRRDNAAAVEGVITLRYGWTDVTERACETAREVGTALAGRGWDGPLRRCSPGCRV